METKDSKESKVGKKSDQDGDSVEAPVYKRPHFVLITLGIFILAGLFLLNGKSSSHSKKQGAQGGEHESSLSSHGDGESSNAEIEARTLLHRLSWSALVETYGQAWLRVQKKVDNLRLSEEENIKLRNENAQLKLGVELAQFNCHALTASRLTTEAGTHLEQETGSKVGRTLAAMTYRPPGKLTPAQLFTLGVSYFKAQEMEKAAVIFTSLTGLEENSTYKNAETYLLAGVTWFYLENYSLSNSYFDQVLKEPKRPDTTGYLAQARLWKALISNRLGKSIKAQYWLKDLLDHHPHSNEAAWVNGEFHAKAESHEKEEYVEGELSDAPEHGASEHGKGEHGKNDKKEGAGGHGAAHEQAPASSHEKSPKGRGSHE